jgi:DNA-binding beta-propeller fold protein YncE
VNAPLSSPRPASPRGSLWPLLVAAALLVILAGMAAPLFFSESAAPIPSAVRTGPLLYGTQGDEPGQFQQPRGIAVLTDGSVVVVDRAARVQHLAASTLGTTGSASAPPPPLVVGAPAAGAGSGVLSLWSMKDHAMGNPKGLCALPDGNVLVCDTHYGRVLKMTPDGEILKIWGEPGTGKAQFIHPLGAAVDPARGVVYVVEYGSYNDRVQKFDLNGQWLGAFGTCGAEPDQLQRPSGVAVGSDGSVFVADACNHRIQRFTPDGAWKNSFGKEGSGDGELRYPYDIAMGSDGLLYVAEFANHRVSVFTQGGAFVRHFGSPGRDAGQFASPWSIAADAHGRVLVSDTGNHRIKVFDVSRN